VLNAVILREQAGGKLIAQRLRGDDLGSAGHGFGCKLRHQAAEIGVASNHYEFRADPAVGCMYAGCLTTVDTNRRALLVNAAAQGLHRSGLAQRKVERVNMDDAVVEHAEALALTCHRIAYATDDDLR